MNDPSERKQLEREEFAKLVLSVRTRLGESQERFAQRFDQSGSSIFKWENCAKEGVERPIDPDNLAIACWEVLAALEKTTVLELRNRIKGGKATPPKSIAELVDELTLLNHQFRQVIGSVAPVHQPPINAVAAEFSRSIQAAIAETGLTYEDVAAKYEVELACLLIVAAGQKVPGYRVAIALQGFLKDKDGNLYSAEALHALLEQEQAQSSVPTKKPPQKKRQKTSHGAD